MTVNEVIAELRLVGEKPFLAPFGVAVCAVDTSNPGPGHVRVAAEIDRIERSFRQTATTIEGLIFDPAQPANCERIRLDDNGGPGGLQMTEDELNFLTEIADILPSLSDSLLGCSEACKAGDLSLAEIASRVETATTIMSRGIERFHPR